MFYLKCESMLTGIVECYCNLWMVVWMVLILCIILYLSVKWMSKCIYFFIYNYYVFHVDLENTNNATSVWCKWLQYMSISVLLFPWDNFKFISIRVNLFDYTKCKCSWKFYIVKSYKTGDTMCSWYTQTVQNI